MEFEQLIVEREGPVTVVRMNNPAKLNALSDTLYAELTHAFEILGADRHTRAIVLTGEGRGFSSGGDLGPLKDTYLKGDRLHWSSVLKESDNKLIAALTSAPKPVIAAVNGVAAGAGLSLALACDIRIASDQARFSAAFVKVGLVPDGGSSWLLPRAVGFANALELAMTGKMVDAPTALAMGLVNRIVPSDRLMEEAMTLANDLAEQPATAVGLIKRVFSEATTLTLAETMEREAEYQDIAGSTDDHVEAVVAFLEKRRPVFKGS